MAFKDRLKSLRSERAMTQEDLAAALDVPPSTIRRYESEDEGMPKIERLQAIADFFGCTVDYLLERSAERYGGYGEHDLSEEERKFLNVFRKLNEKDQNLYLEVLERLHRE